MAIQDFKKSKSISISAIMRDKKLAAAINDALNSPAGSTRREKGRSILKSVNRMAQNPTYGIIDGQGGPFDSLVNPFLAGGVQQTAQNVGLSPQQNTQTASQTTPSLFGAVPGVPSTQPNVFSNVTPPAPVPEGEVAAPVNKQVFSGITPPTQPGTNLFAGVTAPGVTPPLPETPTVEQFAKDQFTQTELLDPDVQKWADAIDSGTTNIDSVPEHLKGKVSIALNNRREVEKLFRGVESDVFGTRVPGVTPPAGTDADPLPAGYQISESLRQQYPGLFEAVEAGVGPTAWAYQIMSDKEKMKQLFPGVPDNMLPEGASLARQLDDLGVTLKEEFKINQLQDNLESITNTSLTIENDLTDYLTARDQYISRLDTLIDGALESTLKMDMGNPNISKRMNNYMNYLYILKGRHQKRYADFLNTAIDEHDAKLTRAQTAYDSAFEQYNDTLTRKEAIVEEDFNLLRDLLESMYENVDSREEDFFRMGILKEQYYQSQYQTSVDALNAVNGAFQKVGPNNIDEVLDELNTVKDENGKVPLDAWLKIREEWLRKFGPNQFEKNFPPEDWLDSTIAENQQYFLNPLQTIKGVDGREITLDDLLGTDG